MKKNPVKKVVIKKVVKKKVSEKLDMYSVVSSNIVSAGYDSIVNSLKVNFMNGTSYIFLEVPKKIFLKLIEAVSAGKYFNKNVKGKYNYKKVG